MAKKVKNVFVLMLENRSFDHFIAFANVPGVPPPPASFGFASGAVDQLRDDPPHEFEDVQKQIAGGTMTGFPQYGGPDAMKGFTSAGIPVLRKLIDKGILFDNYFSSVPGPTWPNRLFAHAASSGGLDNSMGTWDMFKAITRPGNALKFDNGHIFDRLAAKGKTWRIYHGDRWPQVLCLKGMVDKGDDPKFFRDLDQLAPDLSRGDVVDYTFIEPDYDLLDEFEDGNSQHPIGKVSEGEKLMAYVYNAIFTNSVGSKSALLLTWDEHGGFFDRTTPPRATPPGDTPHNASLAKHPQKFAFDRFGVRVPSVLISPWLPQGLGSRIYGSGKHFDHSSVIRALRETFNLGAELTKRDKDSPDWTVAELGTARALGRPFAASTAKLRRRKAGKRAIHAKMPLSGNVLAWARIAMDLDWRVSEQTNQEPLHLKEYFARLVGATKAVEAGNTRKAALVKAEQDVLEYIAAVDERREKLRKANARKAAKPSG